MAAQKMKKYYVIIILLAIALLVVMLNTQPDTVPLYILMVPFTLIFALGSLITYVIARKLAKRPHTNGLITFSVFTGALLALALGLNSVGSLLPREIAIVLIFFSLLVFYALKRRLS